MWVTTIIRKLLHILVLGGRQSSHYFSGRKNLHLKNVRPKRTKFVINNAEDAERDVSLKRFVFTSET